MEKNAAPTRPYAAEAKRHARSAPLSRARCIPNDALLHNGEPRKRRASETEDCQTPRTLSAESSDRASAPPLVGPPARNAGESACKRSPAFIKMRSQVERALTVHTRRKECQRNVNDGISGVFAHLLFARHARFLLFIRTRPHFQYFLNPTSWSYCSLISSGHR